MQRVSAFSASIHVDPHPLPLSAPSQDWFSKLGGDLSNIRSISDSRGGGGGNDSTASLSRVELRKNVNAIRDEQLGHGDKGDFITVKVSRFHVRAHGVFAACAISL